MMPDALITVPPDGLAAALRLAVAALLGLAVGIERQWSGHASGPAARFAGMRTFFILGIIGGISGLLVASGQAAVGVALVSATAAFIVAAFVVTMRRPQAELDGTTEAAALAVLGLSALAGGGQMALAAGATAAIVFALSEKQRLHDMVSRVGKTELLAAARFAVMALVILPLLPAEPLSWLEGVSPRGLWTLVVVFSAVNFVGYIALRTVGADRGYGISGLVGGLVSSTAVMLQFARRSRDEPQHAAALARGAVAASTVVPLRLLAIMAAITPAVASASLKYMVAPAVVGGAFLMLGLLRHESTSGGDDAEARSPLNVVSSLKMAAFLTLALAAVEWIGTGFGAQGVLTTAAALGFGDTDALTVSMARMGRDAGQVDLAAMGVAVGLLSNTAFKLAFGLVLGSPRFRAYAALGLGAMALAIGAGFVM
jgi:uncharacterized membrane protein (DUF4010 family)